MAEQEQQYQHPAGELAESGIELGGSVAQLNLSNEWLWVRVVVATTTARVRVLITWLGLVQASADRVVDLDPIREDELTRSREVLVSEPPPSHDTPELREFREQWKEQVHTKPQE